MGKFTIGKKLNENREKILEAKCQELQKKLDEADRTILELLVQIDTMKKTTIRPKQREITEEQIKEIKLLRDKGLTYRQIEDRTKWSKGTIYKVLKGIY